MSETTQAMYSTMTVALRRVSYRGEAPWDLPPSPRPQNSRRLIMNVSYYMTEVTASRRKRDTIYH